MQRKGTWVTLFFVFAAVLVALVLNLAFRDLFSLLRVDNAAILGDKFRLSALCAVGVSALLAGYTALVNKRSYNFVEQAIVELDKAAWPTFSETKTSTVIVIVFSLIASIILGVFDALFSRLTSINLDLGSL